MYAHPDIEMWDLRRKLGFLRLSIKYNVPVIPAISFNETGHYYQLVYDESKRRFPLFFCFQQFFHNITGLMLPVLYHVFPLRTAPVITVVGEPLIFSSNREDEKEPSIEDLTMFMNDYIAALKKLYETYAPIYNAKTRKLHIT